MLKLIVEGEEYWDETAEKFVYPETITLELEHSLVSLSKWEEKYERPFLGKDEKNDEETLFYLECMILTQNFPPEVFSRLKDDHIVQVDAYINRKMTGTTFREMRNAPRANETISAELIYFWMSTFGIPWEARDWHINKLFTLIKVHSVKNAPPEKVDPEVARAQRRAENERRRAQLGTRG
jgi:hypothetical protein